ncbi:hypothetical protein SDC9_85345 [bioreactor metagenome]|uniref:Uncharacterized protein n=1 Tax=bioreactor metagenome TaxID=1076179 RepID=A0A644ZCV5_9ZZZZ
MQSDPRNAQQIVVGIALQDHLAFAAVIRLIAFSDGGEKREVHNLSILNNVLWIVISGVFTDYTAYARHGRAGKIVLPVELDQRWQNQRQIHINLIVRSIGRG